MPNMKLVVFRVLCRVVRKEFIDVSEVITASTMRTLTAEAVSSDETKHRDIPEDGNL